MKKLFTASLIFLSACNTELPKINFSGTTVNLQNTAQNYVPGTEDVPLYTGFLPVNKNNLAYDSEGGRLVDATYFSKNANAAEVKKFYAETLPELGWKSKKPYEYTRDGESMKVVVTEKNGTAFIKFVIKPLS